MKRLVGVACGLVMVAGVTGCGSSPDSLMKEQVTILNQMAEAMDSADPQAKLEELAKKLNGNAKKLDALKLSDAAKKKLDEKYGQELQKARLNWIAAMQKNVDKVTNLNFTEILKNLGGTGAKKQ